MTGRGPPIIFGAITAAALVAVVLLARDNAALRRELAALRSAPAPAEVAAKRPIARPERSVADTGETNPASPSVSPAQQRPPGGDEPQRREFNNRRTRGAEMAARALSDPDARAAMLTRMKGDVDRRFGDYFVKLGLDEIQIEALRTLLAERQMARMEAGLLQRTAGSDQERADAESWRESKLASTEAEINAILGADGLTNLQAYLDSAPQRRLVDDISRRANYLGAPLSESANNRLLDAVRQANVDHPLPDMPMPGRGGWGGRDDDFGPITEANVTRYVASLRERNRQIIEQAKEFLTQPQLEALADQQIEDMQQVEAQLNFMLRNPDARAR